MQELQAALLGVVEGLTEFVPVSSTGHLILAGHWIGFHDQVGHEAAATFEVVIQTGAILAVVAAYPGRFAGLLDFNRKGFGGWRGVGRLLWTSLPALIVGLLFHDAIKQHLFSPWSVAVGLAVGSLWIFGVEWRRPRVHTLSIDEIGWNQALAVGLFQCLALWPGMSRSAATILGGMMLGIDRKTATEYSFFAAVPVLCAAALADLWKSYQTITPTQVAMLAIGLAVSFVSAYIAVKWLLRFVASHSLNPFAWYRLALAALVGLLWASGGLG